MSDVLDRSMGVAREVIANLGPFGVGFLCSTAIMIAAIIADGMPSRPTGQHCSGAGLPPVWASSRSLRLELPLLHADPRNNPRPRPSRSSTQRWPS